MNGSLWRKVALAGALGVLQARAAVYHVTPTGAGAMDGSDWDNAFGAPQLQAAITACSGPGDEIRLRYGVYASTGQLEAISRPGLTVRGGYEGIGSPGGFTNDPTVLTRALNVTNRILFAQDSTLTFDRLSITNGLNIAPTSDVFGAGLYLTNCYTRITNCYFQGNRVPIPYRNPATTRAHKGGAICVFGGTLEVAQSRFKDNGPNYVYGFSYTGSQFGDGLFAQGAVVTLADTVFENNASGARDGIYGAGLYLYGGTAAVTRCTFNTNTIYNGWTGNGAAIYAENVKPLTITDSVFRGNTISGPSQSYSHGGALYLAGCAPFTLSACRFDEQMIRTVSALPRGSSIYVAGAGTLGEIIDCVITDYNSLPIGGVTPPEKVYVDTPAGRSVTIRNTAIRGGTVGGGLFKTGTGLLTMTNCLVALTGGSGLEVAAGTAVVAQCTLADNMGWGLSNGVPNVRVSNSILWGNYAGGVKSTNGTFASTCSQEFLDGPGNSSQDPLFMAGYYLSLNGLPFQGASSPCIDAGSVTAAEAGLDALTTRTDGTADSGQADLGYHAAGGLGEAISNRVLYVDVTAGNNSNDGWTAGTPLKTITAALRKAIDGSAIQVATGRYHQASGEVFPLSFTAPNLSVVGAGRETTVLDATGTNGVMAADGGGRVRVEGMTLANGRALQGAGLYLPKCLGAVVSNCTFFGNRIPNTSPNNSYGGGIYAMNGTLVVSESVFRGNGFSDYMSSWGGGLYAANTDLILANSLFETNFLGVNSGAYGVGVYLSGGRAVVSGCTFSTNLTNKGYNHQGGALNATGVSPLTISNCVFRGNALRSGYYFARGGALSINACNPLTLVACQFSDQVLWCGSAGVMEGSDLYLYGASGGTIGDCTVSGQAAIGVTEDFYIETPSPTALAIRNLAMRGWGNGAGIRKKGTGSLSLDNALICLYGSHGLQADAGTVALSACTLGDNVGWGLTNMAASLTVSDSIAWGNGPGGISPGGGTVAYTCSQEPLSGTGNLTADPRWIGGYYLSAAGLPAQSVSSPCFDAGSVAAAALGLDSRTTRTDGTADSGVADLGYHAASGFPGSFSNLTLYVNGTTGDNGNNGWSPGQALKTVTEALGRAIDGTAIFVATGTYNQALGEVFPLVSTAPNLTVIGGDRQTTILDATRTNRVFSGLGGGRLRLEGLTFANGSLTDTYRYGGGVYLSGCQALITNCVIVSNRIESGDAFGQGLAVLGGSLTVVDSVVSGNGKPASNGARCFGGGLYAANTAVAMRRVTVSNNVLKVNAEAYGAGLYASGGSAMLEDCAFQTNRSDSGHQFAGGAIYATGVSPLTVEGCSFVGNFLYASHYFARGGAFYISACNPMAIRDCLFEGNQANVNPANWSGLYADGLEGRLIHLAGAAAGASLEDFAFRGMAHPRPFDSQLFLEVTAANALLVRNVAVEGGGGIGFRKRGAGVLAATNVIVHSMTNHGVMVDAGSVVLGSSTFAANGGWGVSNATGAVTGRNSLAWGNARGGFKSGAFAYTDSQESLAGEGNRNADPLFVNPAAGDFRLQRASPCVEAGLNEPWMTGATDLAGQPRLRGKKVDMGAYEMQNPPVGGTVVVLR